MHARCTTRQLASGESADASRRGPAHRSGPGRGQQRRLVEPGFAVHRAALAIADTRRTAVAAGMAAAPRASRSRPRTTTGRAPGTHDTRPRCRSRSTGRTSPAGCSSRSPWPSSTAVDNDANAGAQRGTKLNEAASLHRRRFLDPKAEGRPPIESSRVGSPATVQLSSIRQDRYRRQSFYAAATPNDSL